MRIMFQQELEDLQSSLQDEGQLVLRSLRGALNALRHQDVELAEEVIAFDDEVDRSTSRSRRASSSSWRARLRSRSTFGSSWRCCT